MLQLFVEKDVEFIMSDHSEYMMAQRMLGMANCDTSSLCVLQCANCSRTSNPYDNPEQETKRIDRIRAGRPMPVEDFYKIIDFFDNIIFCGQISDPVRHPKFKQLLDIMALNPYKNFIIATAAHQKNIEWYEDAFKRHGNNVTWTFGLDGLPDTSFLYRIKQNSQLIYDAMLLAAKLGKNVRWQFIVFDYNEHQIEEAKKIAKEHGITFMLTISNRKQNGFASPQKYKEKYLEPNKTGSAVRINTWAAKREIKH